MIKSVNDALGNTKPFSSVSVWFDRMTSNNFKEDDFEGIPELVESINLQSSGPAEASRCVRKKLKYGSVHGQKRAITILAYLVENCGPRFQTSFADERLVNQIKLTAADTLIDASVRRKLMRTLLSWQQTYSSEPTMRTVAGLYAACGGGRERAEREAQRKRSEAEELVRKREEARRKEMQVRMDRKTAEKLQKEEDKKRSKNQVKGQPRRFDYEREKPNILNHLAVSSSAATALVNALQHVNREKEAVSGNARTQQALERVKTERKIVVRYIQLCREEEMVGALIEANDRIMVALQLYDKLANPHHSDSEDEGALVSSVATNRATAQQRAAAEEAEIEAIRKRLAEAPSLDDQPSRASPGQGRQNDDWEGEIEKLQFKQRRGIERHNSRRALGGSGGSAMQDLLDLDFDETASTGTGSVGPSLRPNRMSTTTTTGSVASGTTGSGSHSTPQRHGTLSDYSDYDSSEDEASAVASAAAPSAAPASSSRLGVPVVQPTSTGSSSQTTPSEHGAALEAWRKSKHRMGIGEETSSLWSKEDEQRWIDNGGQYDDDDEDGGGGGEGDEDGDPFGDEWEEVAGRLKASGAEPGRTEWAAV